MSICLFSRKPLTYRLDLIEDVREIGEMFEEPKTLILKNGQKRVLEFFTAMSCSTLNYALREKPQKEPRKFRFIHLKR